MLLRMPIFLPTLILVANGLPAAEHATRTKLPIVVYQPSRINSASLPAVRTPLGLPNDYKPWIAQLQNGDLLIVAFAYGGVPKNQLKEGESYSERAIFFRSRDGGQTWLPREERRDIHGREFALAVLSDGSIIMPCHFLANDAFNESGHTYSKIFRSADHGKTWSETRIGPRSVSRAGFHAKRLDSVRNPRSTASGQAARLYRREHCSRSYVGTSERVSLAESRRRPDLGQESAA